MNKTFARWASRLLILLLVACMAIPTAVAETVEATSPTSVTLDQSGTVTVSIGDTLTLNATVTPDYVRNAPLEWKSSDESILWVDGYGNVTAVGKGIAKIGVRARADVYDVCAIKVE